MTPRTIAVIYDTSFIIRHDLFVPSRELCPGFSLRHYVGRQVKQELSAQLNDPDMKEHAVVGRGYLIKIMQDPGYQEVTFDVDAARSFNFLEPLIGPDSDVDKQLIAFAAKQSENVDLVFIATRDGGIEAELVAQRNAFRMTNVYSPSMEADFKTKVGMDLPSSFKVRCPHCYRDNVVASTNAGIDVQCLHCKQLFLATP